MSLAGTFATMPFPDLMQWIGDTRRTGLLTVALEFEERYIKVADGAIVALGSDDPRARDLARLLLLRGLIDEKRLRRALEERERTRRPLRRILVEDGYMAPHTLAAALHTHAKDVILQLFLWHDGRFLFSTEGVDPLLTDPLPPDAEFAIEPPIPAREVLMDGMRRIDDWKRMTQVLASDYTTVHALGRAADLPAVEALAELGEPLCLGDLCLRLARPRFEIVEDLYEGWRRGIVAVDARPHQIARPFHQSPTDMLVHTARTLLGEKQFDEAATLLRSALDLDPYQQEARYLLHRARGEQLEELYREIPPYRVPAVRVAREKLHDLELTPRERYLLSRIDGKRDVGTLTLMTPLGELETLRALKRFSHVALITLS